MRSDLPDGVGFREIEMHSDERGTFSEIFRREWGTGIDPVQWNVARSEPGVLRGVHVHIRHADYLVIVDGTATIGLKDLRSGSSTEGQSVAITMEGKNLTSLVIPPGVAHGFLFHSQAMHVYAVSHYWDLSDEHGCHWADPDLQIDWPFAPSMVSRRDAEAGSLSEMLATIQPFQPIGRSSG